MIESAAVAISVFVPELSRESEVALWQVRIDTAASRWPGYLGSRFATSSSRPDHRAAAIVFDDADNLRAWLSSDERRDLAEQATSAGFIHTSYPDLVLLPGEYPPPGAAVFLHSVRRGAERDFVEREQHVQQAAASFPGFDVAVLFGPGIVPGAWVSAMKFESAEALDAWMGSSERSSALAQLAPLLQSEVGAFTSRTPFGSVVRVEAGKPRVTPDWKAAMTVLLVLYPTVMLLSRFLSPWLDDRGLRPWLAVFVGNGVSVALLTWALMPVASRVLHRWLDPVEGRPPRVSAAGALAVCAGYAVALLVFALVPFLELGS